MLSTRTLPRSDWTEAIDATACQIVFVLVTKGQAAGDGSVPLCAAAAALQLIIAADRGHTDAIQLLLRRGTQANFVVAAVLVSEKHCSSAAAGVASVGGRD